MNLSDGRFDDGRGWDRRRVKILLTVAIFFGVLATVLYVRSEGPGSVSISIFGNKQFGAGALEQVRVRMKSEHGTPQWSLVSWGDGSNDDNSFALTYHGPCYQLQPTFGSPHPIVYQNPSAVPPGENTIDFHHRYRRPGMYRVTVHAIEYRLCTHQRSPTATAHILLHVTGPAAPGNGPAQPSPDILDRARTSYDSNGVLRGSIEAEDSDGYLRSITVTWPDGSTRTYLNPNDCADPSNVWPNTGFGFHWARQVQPGIYSIKAVATSTDCNRRYPQMTTLIVPFRLFAGGTWKWWGKATETPRNGKILIIGEPTEPQQLFLDPSKLPPEP